MLLAQRHSNSKLTLRYYRERMKKVFVSEEGEKVIDDASAIGRCTLIHLLQKLFLYGPTGLPPGRVKWISEREALIFAPDNLLDIGFAEGYAAQILLPDPPEGATYIRWLRRITLENPDACQTMLFEAISAEVPPEAHFDLSEYTPIDEDMVFDQTRNPFVNKTFWDKNSRNHVPSTPQSEMKAFFFPTLQDLRISKSVQFAHSYGQAHYDQFRSDSHEIVLFDEHRNSDEPSLREFIKQQIERHPARMIVTMFLDDTEITNRAHQDFFNMMANWSAVYFPMLQITFIDVIVKTDTGPTSHYDDFAYLHKTRIDANKDKENEPAPFIMISGRVPPELRETYIEHPRIDDRLVEIDLFGGVLVQKKQTLKELRYQKNVRSSIHEFLRVAGVFSQKVRGLTRDYTDLPDDERMSNIKELCRFGLVISYSARRLSKARRAAEDVYATLKRSGYPYLTLVREPGSEDCVRIYGYLGRKFYDHSDFSDHQEAAIQLMAQSMRAYKALNYMQ